MDDDTYKELCDPGELSKYIRLRMVNKNKQYYVFIDEVQYAISQEEIRNLDTPIRLYGVLNGLLRLGNVGGEKAEVYEQYAMFGGMPHVLSKNSDEKIAQYLSTLFSEVYFKDIFERYSIELEHVLAELTNVLCSSIDSLTNVKKFPIH